MNDMQKTKAQLIEELQRLRARLEETERAAAGRKRAEKALREGEGRLQGLFETMAEGMIFIAPDGQIVQANPAAERILGLKRSVIEARNYVALEWELLRPDGTPMSAEEMAGPRAMKERRLVRDVVMGVKRPDGSIFWINVSSAPLINEADELQGVVGTFADITERKRAEEELHRSHEQLRALAANLESVREEERKHVARLIHDELGHSLVALRMDMSWLEKRMTQGNGPEVEAGRCVERLKSMGELVDRAVDSVRRIAASLRPGVLDVGLAEAVEWLAEDFQKRTGVECAVPSLPESTALDRHRSTALFRILEEVLVNAARHAEATKVEVSLVQDAHSVVLTVRDDGKGIEETEIRSPHSLGLAGMRERALAYGGELNITGVSGKGTTIEVRMPLGHPESGSIDERGRKP